MGKLLHSILTHVVGVLVSIALLALFCVSFVFVLFLFVFVLLFCLCIFSQYVLVVVGVFVRGYHAVLLLQVVRLLATTSLMQNI